MAEKNVEGVEINKTGNKQWEKNYRLSDVQAVFRRVHPKSWNDLVTWLEKNGDQSNELTPGEAVAMKEDFQRLAKSNASFSDNADKAFEMAHKDRAKS